MGGLMHERIVEGIPFRYFPETGEIWRWVTHQGRRKLLTPCWRQTGLKPNNVGYIVVGIGSRKIVLGHRLAWFIVYGEWPETELDHDDRNRANNVWANLVPATHAVNHKNVSKRTDNTSGVTGVYWRKDKSRWQAFISAFGKVTYLGLFARLDEAKAARKSAEIVHQYHPKHGL